MNKRNYWIQLFEYYVYSFVFKLSAQLWYETIYDFQFIVTQLLLVRSTWFLHHSKAKGKQNKVDMFNIDLKQFIRPTVLAAVAFVPAMFRADAIRIVFYRFLLVYDKYEILTAMNSWCVLMREIVCRECGWAHYSLWRIWSLISFYASGRRCRFDHGLIDKPSNDNRQEWIYFFYRFRVFT